MLLYEYSFNLLGLVIEKVTSKPYHEVLHNYLFQPLEMKSTYLSQDSQPAENNAYPVAHLHLNGKKVDVESHRRFSSIYAGGHTVSTSEDLLKFISALAGYELIKEHSLLQMMEKDVDRG